MNVPFLDLNAPYRELKTELDAAYQRVMASGWFIMGAEVKPSSVSLRLIAGLGTALALGTGWKLCT